jgi:hypothetical protein
MRISIPIKNNTYLHVGILFSTHKLPLQEKHVIGAAKALFCTVQQLSSHDANRRRFLPSLKMATHNYAKYAESSVCFSA